MKLRIIYILIGILLPFSQAWAGEGEKLLRQGIDYIQTDNFPMAMKCLTRSLETAEHEKDWHTVIVSNGYIGNVYFNINDYTRSLQYLLKGYAMCDKYGEHSLKGNFLTNIVANYAKLGNVKEAWTYYHLLERQTGVRDPLTLKYYVIYNRARIALAEGKPQEALAYHQKALYYAQKQHLAPCYSLFQYCEMGQIFLHNHQSDKALEYGSLCLEKGSEHCSLDLLTSVYQLMADAYSIKGDHHQESHYRSLYLSLSDSLFNRKDIFSADNELVEYENRLTNEHISSLNGVISRQTFTLIAVSVMALTLMLLTGLLLRNNRKLKMAHRALIDKNRQLQQQEHNSQQLLQQWADRQKEVNTPSDNMDTPSGTGPGKEQMQLLLNKIVRVFSDLSYIARPDFNLNMLAEAVGSNTKYVSQVINETYGKNFKTLLNERRISEASRRLADQQHYANRTIQAVYEEVGYTNAVSFIRAFRKINGMTPSEYLKMASQGEEKDCE